MGTENIKNKEFNVPYYIFEEITEYMEQKADGRNRCMKWQNIKKLLKLAVVSNRITEEQAKFIENRYCREE